MNVRVIAVVAALVAGANLAARLVIRLAASDSGTQVVSGVVTFCATAVAAAIVAFVLARRYPMGTLAGGLFFATVVAAVAIVALAPLVSGGGWGTPMVLFGRLLLADLAGVVGAAIGTLLAVALGLDPRTRAYRAYVERRAGRPR